MKTNINSALISKCIFSILLWIIFIIFYQHVQAQIVNEQEAKLIAKNWISITTDKTGGWGEFSGGAIESIQEFKRDQRILGYYAPVKPCGFILVSLRKELTPVKAYSTSSNLNTELDKGLTDFLKFSMERILDTIEMRLGPIEDIHSPDLRAILEIDYSQTWDQVYQYKPGTWIDSKLPTKNGKNNYQEGDILLEGNNWHQFPPYNDDCPWMDCTTTSNGRAVVGCVATAGAQIMHYWDWPPFGVGSPYNDTYNWPNMPDVADVNSPQAVIDALAELNHEVGIAVGMSYGCSGSGATTSDMVGVYENNYRYSTACGTQVRLFYSAVDWFERIKTQLNQNRPVQYRIPGHSIVVDGWQESGSPVVREYHVNYGWTGTGNDTWWLLDAIPGCDIAGDYLIENIVPATALGSWIFGAYNTQSFNYRYFDRDAIGYAATFQNGQFLQFLPEVVVTGMSPTDPIIFNGSDFLNLRMFTGGDLSHGIRIYDASIELTNFGSIKFYDD